MPSRKAEQILSALKTEILTGVRKKGGQLPTYDALMEQFGVTRPTIARVLAALREQGLVTVRGTRGVFVAENFPHDVRYFWVTSEQPGSLEWTTFLATFLELIQHNETGLGVEIIPLVGVDGRANNPEYAKLCRVVDEGSAAGLMVMNSAVTYQLPVLENPGLPRVAIWAPLPHAALVRLAFEELIDRACAKVLERARKIAVVSPHIWNLNATVTRLCELGADKGNVRPLHVTPIGCESLIALLFERTDRPEAIFVTDDNLVAPLLIGLNRAGLVPGRDVYVLAHCNWPRPVGMEQGVEHIGFDVREVLAEARNCIEAQRQGEVSPERVVPSRFLNELTSPIVHPEEDDG
jgi:DNA-binding transcriptional regulator YhcF (GntR family)